MPQVELTPTTKTKRSRSSSHIGDRLLHFQNRKEKGMKRITLLLSALLLCTGCPDHDEPTPQQQLQQAQTQLVKQQASTGNWQIASGIFAVGSVVLFFVGTAFGSKARKEA